MPKITSGPGWALSSDEEPKPGKNEKAGTPVAKIRLEKRVGGKSVTVITGLHTYGTPRLNDIARKLKSICGAGGTVKHGTIEIQGDQVERIRGWFSRGERGGRIGEK